MRAAYSTNGMTKTTVMSSLILVLASCAGSDFSASGSKKSSSGGGGNSKPAASGGTNSPVLGDGSSLDTSGGCMSLPAGSDALSSSKSGDSIKNTFFHRSVATDPGHTNADPGRTWAGYKPYTISPDSELSSTDFTVTPAAFLEMQKQSATELEYFVFAHQFGSGLDKISFKLHTKSDDLSDVSTTNIYSAYGYVSVKNIHFVNSLPVGDVDLFSFNYDPNGSGPLHDKLKANPAIQDATDIVGPASQSTTAKVSKKGISLEDFKLTIIIGADSYDSVQYRAIRANVWSAAAIPSIPICK